MAELSCPSREQLLAYHVGQLPEDCAEAVIGHLSDCAACQSLVRTFEDAPESLLGLLQLHAAEHEYLCEPQCQAAVASAQSIVEASLQAQHGQTLGDYDLLETLGEGGMGTVYKARHTKLHRIVALKIIRGRLGNPRAGARFQQEMTAVGRLRHPHIVRADDAREIDGMPVLVMEYIDGLDLARLVQRIGPLPIADACELARQAALGLQAVDEAKLVHRDIKPSNVMVSREGHVKILDLGLALLCSEPSASPGLTHSGDAVGSADYIAPEQIEDSHHVDIRADLYSLGCMLYHLLTGQLPFAGPRFSSRLDKLVAHREHRPPPLGNWRGEVPEDLAALMDRLLSKDPANRPSAPADLAETLVPFAAGADLPALVSRAMQQAPAESMETRVGTEDKRSACSNTSSQAVAKFVSHRPSDGLGSAECLASSPLAPVLRGKGWGEGPARSAWVSDPAEIPDRGAPSPPAAKMVTEGSEALRRTARLRRWLAIAASSAVILLVSAAVISLRSRSGLLTVTVNETDVEVTIDGRGETVRISSPRDRIEVRVPPGLHELQVTKDGFQTTTRQFSITRNGRVELRVELQPLEPVSASQTARAPASISPGPTISQPDGSAKPKWSGRFATAREIVLDETNHGQVTGRLNHPDDVHYYRFVARLAGPVEVVAVPEPGLTAQLWFYDARRDNNADGLPDGIDSHISDGPTGVARISVTFRAGDTYFAVVESKEEQSTGGYRLEIKPQGSRATAEVLTFDSSGTARAWGYLGGIDQERWYTWTSARSGHIEIHLRTPESSLDTRLELYDGDAPAAGDDNTIRADVAARKQYWLRVRVNRPVKRHLQPRGDYTIELRLESNAKRAKP